MKFFDTHAHAQFAAFGKDYKEVIQRALDAGVALVNVGTQRDTSKRAVEVAHEFAERVYATVGLHPIHAEKSYHDAKELGESEAAKEFTSRGEEFDYEYYKKLASDPRVVAIGECGLDYYRLEPETRGKQKQAFEAQVALAKEIGKPLMIHCRSGASERTSPQNGAGRDAFADLIEVLKPYAKDLKPSVVHFFTGTVEDARSSLELGFSFTFGGVITFARDYDEAIKLIPLDRILSETDAPYVAPAPYRGKRNEPVYVVEVVKKLAELKGVSVEEMRNQIWENAGRIFDLS